MQGNLLDAVVDLVKGKKFRFGVKLAISVLQDLECLRQIDETVAINDWNVELIFGCRYLEIASTIITSFLRALILESDVL